MRQPYSTQFLILFLSLCTLSIAEEVPPFPFIGAPSPLVNGVNVMTGAYSERVQDLMSPGLAPLSWERSTKESCSQHESLWKFNHDCSARMGYEVSIVNPFFQYRYCQLMTPRGTSCLLQSKAWGLFFDGPERMEMDERMHEKALPQMRGSNSLIPMETCCFIGAVFVHSL